MGARAYRAVMIACAACGCGDDGQSRNDGGDPPSGGEVTALVDVGGVPVVGARVVFQNADSSVVADTKTDAGGSASAELGAGGFVSVVAAFGASPTTGNAIQTVAGVQAGDRLVFHQPAPSGAFISVPVTIPGAAGFSIYDIDTTCGGGDLDVGSGSAVGSGDVLTMTILMAACPGGVADVLVTPLTDDFANQVGIFQSDVAIADGQPIAIAGSYQPFGSTQITLSNVPASVTGVGFDYELRTDKGVIATSGDGGSSTTMATISVPPGDYAFVDTEHLETASPLEERDAIGWGPSSGPQLARDLGGAQLPGFATIPQYDAASRTLSWTESAGSGAPNFAFAWIAASRDSVSWQWQIAAPYTSGSIAYPTLPVIGFDYNVAAGDTAGAAFTATLAIAPDTAAGVRGGIFASDSTTDIFDGIRVGSAGQIFDVQCDAFGECKP